MSGASRYEDLVVWQLSKELQLGVLALSLTETHNSLGDGQDRGYFTATQTDGLQRLAGRAAKAATGLIRYLESPAADEHRKGRRPRPSR